jgi:transposase
MQAGHSWQEAATRAGIQTSRSAAYRLLQNARTRGKAAFQDGRHGHSAKLREAVLQWLLATCRAAPQMPSREVQAALQDQFGIHVSIGHLNCVRVQLGIGNNIGHQKKIASGVSLKGTSVARGRWGLAARRHCTRDRIAGNLRACIACLCTPFHLTSCAPFFHLTPKPLTHSALFVSCWPLTSLGFARLHR